MALRFRDRRLQGSQRARGLGGPASAGISAYWRVFPGIVWHFQAWGASWQPPDQEGDYPLRGIFPLNDMGYFTARAAMNRTRI